MTLRRGATTTHDDYRREGLLPFMLLLSYVLRIATVAKRTLSIGPFILRETERTAHIDWDQ